MATTKMHLEFVGPDDLTEDLAQAITKRVQELFGSSSYSGIEWHSLTVVHDRVLSLPEPGRGGKAPEGELRHAVRKAIANPRIHCLLERNGLYRLTQLAQFTEDELLHIDQFGTAKLNPTRAAMRAAGFDFLARPIPLRERNYEIIPVCMLRKLDTHRHSNAFRFATTIMVKHDLMVGEFTRMQDVEVTARLDDFVSLDPELEVNTDLIMRFVRAVQALVHLS